MVGGNKVLTLGEGLVKVVAPAAPCCVVVASGCRWVLVAGLGTVSAQRSPLGWAMGSSHRLAAIAAASHARNYYNHTQPEVSQTEAPQYSVNILFIRLVTLDFQRTFTFLLLIYFLFINQRTPTFFS